MAISKIQDDIDRKKFLKKINSNRRTENSGLAYLINPIEEIQGLLYEKEGVPLFLDSMFFQFDSAPLMIERVTVTDPDSIWTHPDTNDTV